MSKPVLVLLGLLVAACSTTPAPEWQSDAQDAIEDFTRHYLAGDTKAAQRYYAEARHAVTGTGRPDLVARLELIRCGLGTASLDYDACAGLEAARADAAPEDQAYADLLAGNLATAAAGKLPPQYASFARAGNAEAQNRALQDIADPMSRLVAAGVLFKSASLSPRGVATAVDAASSQAYRRPLLAWLNVQARLAEEAGDTAALAAIRKRIELAYEKQN